MEYLAYIAVGVAAGLLSGFFGVGGGIILIPGMVLLLGYNQLQAQGTSLGVLLLPVTLFGFLQYWRNPEVQINLWAILCIGMAFALAAYFGGRWANQLDMTLLRKFFAVFIAVVSVYLFFKR